MWWWLAWIPQALCWLCQPVGEEAQTALRGEARDLFSRLRGWVHGEGNARGNAVVEAPVDSTSPVGMDETVQEIQKLLRDDEVGIIGICGMGGIGKTALLREINNHLLENKASRGNFNVVIWVTVSREVSIPKIQKQIGDRLGLSFTDSESAVEEQAGHLFRALSKKRFLLLLDDLWAELDLVKVGIPVPNSHKNCKVAFTTRSLQVCRNMDAAKIVDVNLLDETQSWELFCSKFSTPADLQNEPIQPLARQVVDKCGGLPLALITVGRAMANRKLPDEWRHAIKALDHSAKELQGMDKVISRIKFSYDCLDNDNLRSALLSCAMYPEDEDIERKELIDHWIGEGLLDVDGVDEHIDRVRNRGHVLISNLQLACLLEAGIEDADQNIRMHNAVRDMVLWINNHEVGNVDGFCVIDRDISTLVTMTQSRGHLIRRIWVRNSDLEGFPHDLGCPNICTLRVNVHRLLQIVEHSLLQGFIKAMPNLRVLDLSYSLLEKLPIEIGSLVELRYLNLSCTQIKLLPEELGGLVNLRQLEFHSIISDHSDVQVPRKAIAGLSSLQIVNLYHVGLNWDTQVGGVGGLQLQLDDLEGLDRLQELHIRLSTSESLDRVLSSNKLCSCTRRLCLEKGWNSPKDGALLRMVFNKMGSHLRELILGNMDHPWVGELRFDLNELPCLELLSLNGVSGDLTITIVGSNGGVTPFSGPSLKMLDIKSSNGLKELKFVGRFPSLELIKLKKCREMEELLLDDDDGVGAGQGERQGLPDSHFPMLRKMELAKLPALRSIGRLGPSSAPKLTAIKCDQNLWDAIEWGSIDGQDIKLIFEPFLVTED